MWVPEQDSMETEAVAIIGMDGRFPGASDVRAYWQNLLDGRDCIDRLDAAALDASIPESLRAQPEYVRARGQMPEADRFDAAFFGISPREAEVLDPQQRIFLEICWRALEDAGYVPGTHDAMTGVFAGMTYNTYFAAHVAQHPAILASYGDIPAMIANEKDYLATRVAYKLDLRGPCINISTACSTSLVAVCHAFNSLLDYQCDIALAGGVSVNCPQERGYLYQEGSIYSPDGHCRPFDAGAQGTVFSNGGGVVVLKRLSEALADNDTIHAVIRGAAMNNDGADKVSFTAPSVQGQSEVVQMAQEIAGVRADEIGYIEAHGTGTSLGDPIEIEALTRAFRVHTARKGYCGIGSVKGNIGHLDAASGIAGLIKATLAVRDGRIPPTLNYRSPNPELHLDASPFHVVDTVRDWPGSAGPRRAGVSSFGLGGTNAHVVLEQAPRRQAPETVTTPQLLVLSAETEGALERGRNSLAEYLENAAEHRLADIAWTLQRGRRAFRHRLAVVAKDHSDAAAKLRRNSVANLRRGMTTEAPHIIFAFPGQGSQYIGMCEQLYRDEPVVRDIVDCCADALRDGLAFDLRDIMFGRTDNAGELLDETYYTQPAMFTLEYALAKLWMARGVKPDALVGHSIGEFAAATLAGVFQLEDAVRLVAVRGQLMQQQPSGSMLSVRAPETSVAEMLDDTVTIAAVNAPGFCVLSGPDAAISRVKLRLENQGVASSVLQTSHAFHSAMMEPVVEAFEAKVAALALSPPTVPIHSTVTGQPLDAADAISARYWARQLREPVRFMAALSSARKALSGDIVIVETGPGKAATTFAVQTFADDSAVRVVGSIGRHGNELDENAEMLDAAARLWSYGATLDWKGFHQGTRRRVPVPTYRFERTRHWLSSRPATNEVKQAVSVVSTQREPEPEEEIAEAMPAIDDGRPVIDQVAGLLAEVSGLDIDAARQRTTFAELGLDSLFLTQFSQALKKRFGLDLRFRQLLIEYNTLAAIATLLEKENTTRASTAKPAPERAAVVCSTPRKPGARQQNYLKDLARRYTWRTSGSKAFSRTHHAHLAEPRTIGDIDRSLRELSYPIVAESSSGSRIRDIDGNVYIDLVNGYGANLLGHSAPTVVEAIRRQLKRGYETGPQTPLAGRVARQLQALTGFERVSFSTTGTEALHAALHVARATTRRRHVVTFGDEFKDLDGGLAMQGDIADSPLPDDLHDIEVLEHGSPRALRRIRELGDTLAAVLVEPVQSRHPERYSPEFIGGLREATSKSSALLVFDELISGFRVHPAGAQGICGARSDLAVYGGACGGGMPLGVLAGEQRFMQALDGDDETAPHVIAGSSEHHPLALAAAEATLTRLLEAGPALQRDLNERAARLAWELEQHCRMTGAPVEIRSFSSWFFIDVDARVPFAGLLFCRLRAGGIHAREGQPCFLSVAHTDADIGKVSKVFRESLEELRDAGFFEGLTPPAAAEENADVATPDAPAVVAAGSITMSKPPVPGARLGRRPDGQPGWFVPDPERPGRFRELLETRAN